jgi:hypothetical protein
LIFVIGLFGAVFSSKYHERSSFHYNRLLRYRDKLDELLSEPGLLDRLREEAIKKHTKEFPLLYGGKLHWWKAHRLWVFLHLLVSLFGLVLTILAIFWPKSPPSVP